MSRLGSGARGAAAALLLLALAACGSDTSEPADGSSAAAETSATAEPTTDAPADAPACADVWVPGAKLPRGYDGCVDPAGAFVASDGLDCSSGQVLVAYDVTFAVLGGTVRQGSAPLAEDRDYRAAVRSCRA